ncbi:helix-turn-helix domain-containing protein [Pyxidicoccus xibeiensis]|uniref:helix-turn-helix domain-containing protein n=1 Tax=Pyxidicoccus xibeiensis TaxID=2906759 RepID=UPI0020A727AE|nr:AraC family transcriptional regulator [Pyxidicoccus xibeiensis]MCP3144356.1 AraC family transcriptional regulator [Pyxidicoccus xibeiensis]
MPKPTSTRGPPARQQFQAATRMERHLHVSGYAAVVVSGGYVEAGDAGRFHLGAGSVVFHRPFEAHADQFGTRGAVVLNLPLPAAVPDVSVAMLRDVDAVVRAAERDSRAAADLLSTSLGPATGQQQDWPDLLAAALRADPSLCLAEQADALGLAAETLARGFKRAYGVSPKRYRAEVRALQAWRMLPGSPLPLAQLALALGYTDQAHMTRDVVALTGRTPAALRRGTPAGGQLDSRVARR